MSSIPQVLTQERVDEINARIDQRGWAVFFDSLVGDNTRRTSEVSYKTTNDHIAALQALLESLSGKGIQYVESTMENLNPKRYGGFSPLVTKRQVRVKSLDPPFINTNVAVWGMEFGWTNPKMLFFPDTVLMFQRKRYEKVPYESLSVGHGTLPSVELSPPNDAEIVEHTWVYTNIDGGPDRRYSHNPRVPIVLYGLVLIKSTLGLRIPLLVPDRALAANFATTFEDLLRPARGGANEGARYGRGGHDKDRGRRDSSGERQSSHISRRSPGKSAYEILEVPPNATKRELVVAYRKMAQMYHPDKVAGLGPEFKELAELRMKELNAAYSELANRATR